MPVENYITTITLDKAAEGNKTLTNWTVEFATDEEHREEMIEILENIYRSDFESLGK